MKKNAIDFLELCMFNALMYRTRRVVSFMIDERGAIVDLYEQRLINEEEKNYPLKRIISNGVNNPVAPYDRNKFEITSDNAIGK